MLSDSKLRDELKKLGVSVGPITTSTRSVYRKRLEKLKKENEIAQKQPVVELKKLPGKPVTFAPRQTPVYPGLRSVRRRNTVGYSTDESEEDRAHEKVNSQPTRPITRQTNSTLREFETKTQTPVHKRIKALSRTPKSSPRSPVSVEDKDQYSDDSEASDDSRSWVETKSMEINTTPSLEMNRSDVQFEKYDACLSKERISDGDRKTNRYMAALPRRRLCRGTPDEEESKLGVKKSLGNGNLQAKTETILPPGRTVCQSNIGSPTDDDAAEAQSQPWSLNFSSFLPIGTVVFFIIVGLLYVTMKYDASLNSIGLPPPPKESEESLKIASLIYDHIGTHAGHVMCGTTSDPILSLSQLTADLGIKSNDQILHKALQKLIINQEWGIHVLDTEKQLLSDAKRYADARYIETEHPILSGWCRFTRALQKVLLRICLIIIIGVIIWLALSYRRYRIEKQKEEREQMFVMVQRILDILRKQYDMSESSSNVQPFLPILHVRDMILAPQERNKMGKIWEKAKKFLSASETRIRVENQRILGEDYLVWRWIQAASPAKRYNHTSRVWQGEAFDISKSINRPMVCPTPCLKIRNMFDVDMEVGKDWEVQIQDSILEKCQGNNEILRICVEKESKEGLVYMLCASNEGAGRAFQALHGAWFDGRLVTVKFIRLHRFHYRFPDSVNQSKVPMRPTSAVPVSTIMSSPSSPGESSTYEKLYPSLPCN